MEEIPNNHPLDVQNLVNTGIDYITYQLVGRISCINSRKPLAGCFLSTGSFSPAKTAAKLGETSAMSQHKCCALK